MSKDVNLTLAQGTALLRDSQVVSMPGKLGDRTFKGSIRGNINKKIRALYKVLKKASPILLEDDLTYFGPRHSWKRKERTADERDRLGKAAGGGTAEMIEKVSYTQKDMKEKVAVHLNGAARDGLTWMLFLWCHPESQMCKGAGQQEMFVWNLAADLKCVPFLEKETGLADNETIEIGYEDEVDEEAKKNETTKIEKIPEAEPVPAD